ncbi:MAG: sugar phosphate nucleotidyltransferase [Melioribacteraceae bacterium]|nr:sugar phosphate nucleotidyltransferase [Melioribacteraceae bacterium]
MELYAVIMAGGVGSRFWPRSKKKKPKQLIRIIGENTLIQDTVNRLEGIVKKENILIITNRLQKSRVREQLYNIPEANIIDEPFGKNTAPCIGLATAHLKKRNKDAVAIVLPADHVIHNVKEFHKTILRAAEFAKNSKRLVTIGIRPSYPETGYGYIQLDDVEQENNIYKVLNFAEKPNIATARRFLEDGGFFWNSGIFVWTLDAIMDELNEYLPEHYSGICEIENSIGTENYEATLTTIYGQLKSISIDYGILEHSKNVYVTKGEFDWSDLGSWEAVYDITPKDEEGNVKIGDVYTENTFGSYIFSPQKFTAVIGAEHLLIINTKDSLLICHRNNAQDVKHVVDYLRMNKRSDLT